MKFPAVLLAFLIILPAAASAQDATKCALPPGTKWTIRLRDFPPALLKSMPGLGDRDGRFQTDATAGYNDLPSNNLSRAFSRNDRWVILYGTGGFANSKRLLILDLSKNGSITQISNKGPSQLPDNICQAIIDGLNLPPAKPVKR